MSTLLALAPTFGKGILVVVCAIILFVGSVYVLLTAVFGLRMGYLVLAVSFFGWMAIFSLIWTLGQPPILGLRGTPANEGPRGTEPHWQIFAAGTDALATKYPETASYPASPWRAPTAANKSSVDTTRTAVQKYLVAQASLQLEKKGVTLCKPDSSPFSSCSSRSRARGRADGSFGYVSVFGRGARSTRKHGRRVSWRRPVTPSSARK